MLLASLASRFAPSVDRRTALRRCTSLLRRLNPLSSTTSPTGLRRRSLASCSAGGAHGVPPELGVTASFRCVGSPKSRDDELVVLGSFGLRPDDVGPGVGFGRVGVPQPGEFAHDPVADRHRIRVAGVSSERSSGGSASICWRAQSRAPSNVGACCRMRRPLVMMGTSNGSPGRFSPCSPSVSPQKTPCSSLRNTCLRPG